MKFASKIMLLIGISCGLMLYSGCKKKEPAPEPVTDQQLDLLTKGPWKISAVTRDNVNEISNYTGFTLTLTGTKGQTTFGFSTGGRPVLSAWPSTGNFTFDATNPTTVLSRNDTPPVSVTYSVNSTQLTMSFQYSGGGYPARVGVVSGLWNFTFTQ